MDKAYEKLIRQRRGTTVDGSDTVVTDKPLTFILKIEENSRKSDSRNTNETLVSCFDGCKRYAVLRHGLESLPKGSVYEIRAYPCLCPGDSVIILPNHEGAEGCLEQPKHEGIMPFYQMR